MKVTKEEAITIVLTKQEAVNLLSIMQCASNVDNEVFIELNMGQLYQQIQEAIK